MSINRLIDEQSLPKILFTGLTVFFYMTTFERIIANIFVLNFGAGALNASILLFLATMTGIFYTFAFNKAWPHSHKQLSSSVGTGFVMILLSAIPVPILALTAVVVFQIAIAPVLIHYLQVLKKEFTASAVLGVSIHIACRSVLNTTSYYATAFGLVLLFTLGIIWLVYWLWMNKQYAYDELTIDQSLTSTSSVFSFMIIQIIFLGSPSVLSTWFLRNYFFSVIAAMLGLIIAWYIVSEDIFSQFNQSNILKWGALADYIIAITIVIWVSNQYISIFFIFVAQFSAVFLLHFGIREDANSHILHMGRKQGGIQFVIILATFFVIGAPFWTAMPLNFLLKRNDKGLMLFVAILLPLSVLRSFLPINQQFLDKGGEINA